MGRLNLLAPEVRNDPYPHYAEMRRSSPVCQVEPAGMWAVSRHDDIARVCKDTEAFSSAGMRALATHPGIEHNPLAESILLMDPPEHTKARALVSHVFGASAIPRLEPLVRAAAVEAVEVIRAGGVVDFCEVMATRVPATAIAALLGLDVELRNQMKRWSEGFESVNPGIAPERIPEVKAMIAAMEGYLVEVLESRRQAPKDDLVSDLLAAQLDGTALNQEEIVSFLCLLLVAGLETTSHLLTNTARFLVHHPDGHDRVRRDPALIPALIEEMLRFDPPAHGIVRRATADVEIGGVPVAAGSLVLLLLASAGRDESKYEAPERFDLDRPKQLNMAFGHGAHFCIGAVLARAEARIALEELFKLPGRFEEVETEHTWNTSLSVRGMVRYLIRYVG